jgi:hypothetical protein
MFEKPTNDIRAGWAMNAVRAFATETGLNVEVELKDAIGDLITNMMHLCGQEEIDFDDILRIARDHHEFEVDEEKEEEEIDKSSFDGVDSDSNDQSYGEAEEIAGAKDSWSLVDGVVPKSFFGKILGVTEHHVVQSLGKTAAIHHKCNLDRNPVVGEVVGFEYDGSGVAHVVKCLATGVER